MLLSELALRNSFLMYEMELNRDIVALQQQYAPQGKQNSELYCEAICDLLLIYIDKCLNEMETEIDNRLTEDPHISLPDFKEIKSEIGHEMKPITDRCIKILEGDINRCTEGDDTLQNKINEELKFSDQIDHKISSFYKDFERKLKTLKLIDKNRISSTEKPHHSKMPLIPNAEAQLVKKSYNISRISLIFSTVSLLISILLFILK